MINFLAHYHGWLVGMFVSDKKEKEKNKKEKKKKSIHHSSGGSYKFNKEEVIERRWTQLTCRETIN